MKFTPIDELPTKVYLRRRKNKVRDFLNEFITQNVKFAKVDLYEGEYAHSKSAYHQIHRRIELDGMPIKVLKTGDEIYLIRTDM